MRRSRTVAAGLVLACVAAPGCGVSSKEEIKPRDPTGQGLTRGPDVPVESTDELRAVEVVYDGSRFQPQQVSVGVDSTVRIVNRTNETTRIRTLEGLEPAELDNSRLRPGESAELSFLDAGTERVGTKGSNAVLEINVGEQ